MRPRAHRDSGTTTSSCTSQRPRRHTRSMTCGMQSASTCTPVARTHPRRAQHCPPRRLHHLATSLLFILLLAGCAGVRRVPKGSIDAVHAERLVRPSASASESVGATSATTTTSHDRHRRGTRKEAGAAAYDTVVTAVSPSGTTADREEEEEDGGDDVVGTGTDLSALDLDLVELADTVDYLVLVGTADGHLHAIDTVTGELKWEIRGGPLLSSSKGSDGYAFLPDLSDGTLYYNDPETNEVRRLSKTVPELASGDPILAPDGNFYIGKKTSTVYAVDYKTGKLRGRFLTTADAMHSQPSTDGAILIGRNEYTLVIQQAKTGVVAWNMTLAQYTSPIMGQGTLQPMTPDGEGTFVVESDPAGLGSVMRCVAETDDEVEDDDTELGIRTTRWRHDFGSRAVSMYGATAHGAFHRLPLAGTGGSSALGHPSTQLIDVLKTQSGLVYAVAAGSSPAHDVDGGVSVYHQEWNEFPDDRKQLQVSSVPHIVGLVPALPYGIDPDDVIGMDPDPTLPPLNPEAPSYALLASTVMVTAFVTATAAWLLRPRQVAVASPPTDLGVASQHSTVSLADSTGADLGSTDSGGQGAAAVEHRRELPIANGEAGSIRLGKIDVYLNRLLGRGSLGTLVYKGQYDGHDIAVKRMLKDYYELAMHEVDLLLLSDDHPNVIRYFAKEEGPEFLYIGLELCVGTLVHVVEGPDSVTGPTPGDGGLTADVVGSLDRKQLAREMLSGLLHLHSLKVVHRDLKPQNVLITHRLNAVISDFGLCKALHEGQSSFHHTENVGTQGWIAPEVLKNNVGRITRAIDVFAAGCVLHYLFSGEHPFGKRYEREKNIRGKKSTIKTGDVLIDSLVQFMIRPKPDRRVSTKRALAHPFFWPYSKQLSFLMDTSDRMETETDGSKLLERFEQDSERAMGGPDWIALVGDEFRQDLRRFRTYHADRAVDLLRAIRNKRHHYGELPAELKAVLGSVPDGYMQYFHERYPQLLAHVYRFVITTSCVDEPLFAPYFEV